MANVIDHEDLLARVRILEAALLRARDFVEDELDLRGEANDACYPFERQAGPLIKSIDAALVVSETAPA